jgi:hypothetical protein
VAPAWKGSDPGMERLASVKSCPSQLMPLLFGSHRNMTPTADLGIAGSSSSADREGPEQRSPDLAGDHRRPSFSDRGALGA